MRLALVALAMAACAPASPPTSPPPTPPPAPAPVDGGTADRDAAPPPAPLPPLDTLAARAPALARGMHEVARGELTSADAAADRPIVHAEAADTCVRVVLASDPPAHVQLRDTRGDVLFDAPNAADTPLGPRGPVCVRKGDSVLLHVEPPAPRALHFVAWASP